MGTVNTFKTVNFSASVEGIVDRSVTSETFSTIRSGSGNDSNTTLGSAYVLASSTTNQFANIQRGIVVFDTSSIVAGATIDSAFIALPAIQAGQNKTGLGSTTLELVSSNPASNNSLTPTDYSTLGSTSYCSISQGSVAGAGTTVLTLTNLTNIIPNGISKFGFILGWDLTGSFTGTWAAAPASTGLAWNIGSILTVSYHFTSPALAITGIGSTISNINTITTS